MENAAPVTTNAVQAHLLQIGGTIVSAENQRERFRKNGTKKPVHNVNLDDKSAQPKPPAPAVPDQTPPPSAAESGVVVDSNQSHFLKIPPLTGLDIIKTEFTQTQIAYELAPGVTLRSDCHVFMQSGVVVLVGTSINAAVDYKPPHSAPVVFTINGKRYEGVSTGGYFDIASLGLRLSVYVVKMLEQ